MGSTLNIDGYSTNSKSLSRLLIDIIKELNEYKYSEINNTYVFTKKNIAKIIMEIKCTVEDNDDEYLEIEYKLQKLYSILVDKLIQMTLKGQKKIAMWWE